MFVPNVSKKKKGKEKGRKRKRQREDFLTRQYTKFNQGKKLSKVLPVQPHHHMSFIRHIMSFFCLQYFSPKETRGILFEEKI